MKDEKVNMSFLKTFLLEIMAGMFIAIGGAGASIAVVSVETPSLAKLISGCIFPGGLAMVILAGSELFTGNCLLVIPCWTKTIKIHEMLRNWVIVYLGNLLGGLLICAMLVYGHTFSLFNGGMAEFAVNTAAAKTSLSFGDAFIRGILCNILVCIAVWMGFAICGYEHSVANMYYVPAGIMAMKEYGIAADGLSWLTFFVNNEIPVTLGNILGGSFVGTMYWAIYLREEKKNNPINK